jgi:threonine synthase
MFNSADTNVRAYAVAGSFDECHHLTRDAFENADLRRRVRLTSANSVNIGRLLPQMVYYFHAVGQVQLATGMRTPTIVVCTPSGNFGNLTAGLIAKRAGLPIAGFVAATNVNDVVPEYLATGRFTPRASRQTIANAMDVGNPSNFERMLWLYDNDVERMRRDICGTGHQDEEVRATIQRVYEERGYLLDPHSAIAYLGIKERMARTSPSDKTVGIFLGTAHPAKFGEIVEPIIGRPVEKPAPLADALARQRHILKMDVSLDALTEALVA